MMNEESRRERFEKEARAAAERYAVDCALLHMLGINGSSIENRGHLFDAEAMRIAQRWPDVINTLETDEVFNA